MFPSMHLIRFVTDCITPVELYEIQEERSEAFAFKRRVSPHVNLELRLSGQEKDLQLTR